VSRNLTELFPDEIAAALARAPILVLPLGTIEWHSHHLPLGLDGLVAADICGAIAEACDGVSGPVSYWGIGGVPYPYTLKLPIELVEPVLSALFEQFGAMGFRVILAFAGHFGVDQTLAIKRAAVDVMDRSPVTVLPLTEYDLVSDMYTGDHAGPGETSLMWAVSDGLVRIRELDPAIALDGVIGEDPRLHASKELGVKLKTAIVERERSGSPEGTRSLGRPAAAIYRSDARSRPRRGRDPGAASLPAKILSATAGDTGIRVALCCDLAGRLCCRKEVRRGEAGRPGQLTVPSS
jgi:creatinine amidohydrolase